MNLNCPTCHKPVRTARKGDIETCTNCFTTCYIDNKENSVKEGFNEYMAKMAETRAKGNQCSLVINEKTLERCPNPAIKAEIHDDINIYGRKFTFETYRCAQH